MVPEMSMENIFAVVDFTSWVDSARPRSQHQLTGVAHGGHYTVAMGLSIG
jgi:hypothetical protein